MALMVSCPGAMAFPYSLTPDGNLVVADEHVPKNDTEIKKLPLLRMQTVMSLVGDRHDASKPRFFVIGRLPSTRFKRARTSQNMDLGEVYKVHPPVASVGDAVSSPETNAGVGMRTPAVGVFGSPGVPFLFLDAQKQDFTTHVSRNHVAVTLDSRGVYRLVDLKSSCGTLFISFKSRRMYQIPPDTPVRLQHGDSFAIGNVPANKTLVDVFRNMFVFTLFKPTMEPCRVLMPPTPEEGEGAVVDAGAKEVLKELESIVQCPVCFELPLDARVLMCGHMLCADCLTSWTSGNRSCPVCRACVSEDVHKRRGFPCPVIASAVRMVLDKTQDAETLAYHKEYHSHYALAEYIHSCLEIKEVEEDEVGEKRKRI